MLSSLGSKPSVSVYQSTRSHTPQGLFLPQIRYKNLKSKTLHSLEKVKGKVKICPRTDHEDPEEGVEVFKIRGGMLRSYDLQRVTTLYSDHALPRVTDLVRHTSVHSTVSTA